MEETKLCAGTEGSVYLEDDLVHQSTAEEGSHGLGSQPTNEMVSPSPASASKEVHCIGVLLFDGQLHSTYLHAIPNHSFMLALSLYRLNWSCYTTETGQSCLFCCW